MADVMRTVDDEVRRAVHRVNRRESDRLQVLSDVFEAGVERMDLPFTTLERKQIVSWLTVQAYEYWPSAPARMLARR